MNVINDVVEFDNELKSNYVELPLLSDGQTDVKVSVNLLRDCVWQGIKYMMDEVTDLMENNSRGAVSKVRAKVLLLRCYQMAKVHYHLLGISDEEIEEMASNLTGIKKEEE